MPTHDNCAKCGKMFLYEELDAKPKMTSWLHMIQFFRGQKYMLSYAARHGYDFIVFECKDCYGPGYLPL